MTFTEAKKKRQIQKKIDDLRTKYMLALETLTMLELSIKREEEDKVKALTSVTPTTAK